MAGSKKVSDKRPADYQDELDVYEAVRKLEKKYGKDLLTEEQRERLREAGRIKLDDNKVLVAALEGAGGDPAKITEIMLYALRKSVEAALINVYRYCSPEEWERKDPMLKRKVVSLFFYLLYGIKEPDLEERLRNVVGKERDDVRDR